MEDGIYPTAGSCSMMRTANTMACLTEVLGLTVPGCSTTHAVHSKKFREAKQSGIQVVELATKGIKPRDIITREFFTNAIVATMAINGSTNTLLHLPAIAHEFGFTIKEEDFEKISRKTPYLVNVKPSGQYTLFDFDLVGSIFALLKEWVKNILI
jgi:dihydroxy-acid dehydratase